jgi:hypothetical protein
VSEKYIISIFMVEQLTKQKAIMKLNSSCYLPHTGFLLGLFFTLKMERYLPPKRRLTFTGIQDVLSH